MSSTRFNQPWITNYIKRLSKRKQKFFNKAHSTKLPSDWTTYYNLKKESLRACQKAYNTYVTNFPRLKDGNSKKLWSFVKSKRKDQCTITSLQHNGQSYTDSITKANLFNSHFSSVFTQEDTSHVPNLSNSSPLPDMPSLRINTEGVTHLLLDIDPYKSTGPDNIPAKFLKETAVQIAPALSLIFQASIDQGILPSDWKEANVVPIHKKGSRFTAANYRPVSLTSICCKILEHIIYSSLITHLDEYNALTDCQHGFHKRRSC